MGEGSARPPAPPPKRGEQWVWFSFPEKTKFIPLAAGISQAAFQWEWLRCKYPASEPLRTHRSLESAPWLQKIRFSGFRAGEFLCHHGHGSHPSSLKAGGAAVGSVLAGLPSAGLTLSFKAALTGAASSLGSLLGTLSTSSLIGSPPVTLMASSLGAKASVAVAGGALAVGAVPAVLGAVGYTGAGITASSLAAKMMSAAAIANGGGVAAGSLVATLQSVGAGGLSLSSKAQRSEAPVLG
uniref:Uncharacterized protein n=1 Tax=Sus scrofa TaxID=9823 RepID=A0A4X1SIA9_PIG